MLSSAGDHEAPLSHSDSIRQFWMRQPGASPSKPEGIALNGFHVLEALMHITL
jgi:hypothetical protein